MIWTLSNADTAKAGEGMAELTYTVGGAIAKSRTWRTVVEPSLSANGHDRAARSLSKLGR